ncbi:DUF393 domain-containing protein [Marinomonas agarivorans]|nr:DUF393 domain-containing protein [Marinomonas agarivorans]
MENTTKLTLFYDSTCILCLKEMRQLQQFDHHDRLSFIALSDKKAMQNYPIIDPVKANRILHAQNNDGQLFLGLDATCLAWRMVGKHNWLSILRWPVIRVFADLAYRFFARHRYRISYLLTGQKPCPSCQLNDTAHKLDGTVPSAECTQTQTQSTNHHR